MKIEMGLSPQSFKLFDDNGKQIVDAPISGVDIRLRPNESRATIYVDFPELDLELLTNNVTLERTCRLVVRDDKDQPEDN